MSKNYDIFVFAGEKSGDLHGGKLLKALHAQTPSLRIFGVGGETMRQQDFDCPIPTENFQVMGFVDVFLALPRLIKLFKATLRLIIERSPKMVVLIDYPGFNLRLARALRRKGYKGKIFHYICPSVWAWGKKRIPLMADSLDKLLSILPFEKACFAGTRLSVDYVGHPLCATIAGHRPQLINTPEGKRIIAIFPGSRTKELKRNLPLLLETAKRLHQIDPQLCFAISCSQPLFRAKLQQAIASFGFIEGKDALLIDAAQSYDLMKISHLALAKSGTVALELALHKVPTVVVYAISKLDLFIARDLLRIRLPYYSLPNILCQREVFPELFGPNLTRETLLSKATSLLNDESARSRCEQDCLEIIDQLGNTDAHLEAARIIGAHL